MVNNVRILKAQNDKVEITVNGLTTKSLLPDYDVYRNATNDKVHVNNRYNQIIDTFTADEVIEVERKDGTIVPINDNDTLFSELSTYFFFRVVFSSDLQERVEYLENNIYEVTYKEDIDISVSTGGSITFPTSSTLEETELVGNAVLTTLEPTGEAAFQTPTVGGVAVTANLDNLGNYVASNNFPDPVGLIFRLRIAGKDFQNLDNDKVIEFWLNDDVIGDSQELTWDVENDSLPIVVSGNVSSLVVNLDNFDADINLTNQLPTNLKKGARCILRKIDTTGFKMTYSDGVINYDFVDRQGEYLELYWTGSKYTI